MKVNFWQRTTQTKNEKRGTLNCICIRILHVLCGGCEALVCGKQLQGHPQKGSVEPPLVPMMFRSHEN